jgi:hypothetical protein
VAKKITASSNFGKCYRCYKLGHIAKYYKFSKKVKNLNLDESIICQIEHLLLEDSDTSNIVDDELDSSSTNLRKMI